MAQKWKVSMQWGKKQVGSYAKYPANCAIRLSSTPGSDGDDNDPYEPKQNKKIVRILTVMVYVFTVSFGKWNSWIRFAIVK